LEAGQAAARKPAIQKRVHLHATHRVAGIPVALNLSLSVKSGR
jgi:hypothetical protein